MKLTTMSITPSNFLLILVPFLIIHPFSSSSSSSRNVLNTSLSMVTKSFDVTNFGATNDGKKDASKAFLSAWNVACSSRVPSKIYVPKGKYLLEPLIFEGNCKSPNILFQIDGTLVAPYDYREISSKSESWIVFRQVNGLQIKGGVLDAKGNYLWDCKANDHHCPEGATSLSIENSVNIEIDGLTSINSEMFHITLNTCQNVTIVSATIIADGSSPNTDGIHLEHSSGITIVHSNIKTGDDCISIGPDNQNVWIEDINCGPGHGISIGSLGRGSDEGVVVNNVTVKSATFTGTTNGLRIKTFSSPVNGIVKDVFFIGASMNNVQNPIIIDQNYCPDGTCPSGQGSRIQIINVLYKGIHGTSASENALVFDCSPKKPCKGLTLQDINLSYESKTPRCLCHNANGKAKGFMQPSNCHCF